MSVSRAVGAAGPFGLNGLMGALLMSATLFASECGPTQAQVHTAHVGLLTAIPAVMLLVGLVVGRRARWRIGITTALSGAGLAVASYGIAFAALRRFDAAVFGALVFWPLVVAGLVSSVLIAHAGVRRRTGALPHADPGRAWRVALVASITMAALLGGLVMPRAAPLEPLFARLAAAACVAAYAALVALVLAQRRTATGPVGRAFVHDPSVGYREPSPREATEPAPRDGALVASLPLLLTGVATVVAVMGLLTAPPPPPPTAPSPGTGFAWGGC